MAEIRRTWKNVRLSGAFSGISGFMRNREKWNDRKEVEKELSKLRGFALHRLIRNRFKRNKIWAHYTNSIWGADLGTVKSLQSITKITALFSL